MDNKQIGNRIKNRRKELKFTLQEIADVVGVASSTIQRYENGRISQLKLPVLESIAKAINVNPVWLIKEDAPIETGISDDDFVKKYRSEIEKQTIHTTINLKDFKKNLIKENELLNNFYKLNELGKEEAIKRVRELNFISEYTEDNKVAKLHKKQIWENEGKEYLMPIACHNDNLSDEEKENMDNIINDFLKNKK